MICDKFDTCPSDFERKYPGVERCIAVSDVLTRPDIDAIAIATHAETLHHIAQEALMAGKHVFVKKPLALSKTDGATHIDLAEVKELVLMVVPLLQYHPVFLTLKECVGKGELGRINYIYFNRLNMGKVRCEANIPWSFAPHDISMLLALASEEPKSVMCTGGNYLHSGIADATVRRRHRALPDASEA